MSVAGCSNETKDVLSPNDNNDNQIVNDSENSPKESNKIFPFNGFWVREEIDENNFPDNAYLYFANDGKIYSFVYPETAWMLTDSVAYLYSRGISNVEYKDNQVIFTSSSTLTRDSKETDTFPDDKTIMVLEKDDTADVDGIYNVVCAEDIVSIFPKCYLKDNIIFFLQQSDDLNNYTPNGDTYEKEHNTIITSYRLENETTLNLSDAVTFSKSEDVSNFFNINRDEQFATEDMKCNDEVTASTIKEPKIQFGNIVLSLYTMKTEDVINAFNNNPMDGISLEREKDTLYYVKNKENKTLAKLYFDSHGFFITYETFYFYSEYPIYTYGGLSPLNNKSTKAQVIDTLQKSGFTDKGEYTNNVPNEANEAGDFYVTDSVSGTIYGFYKLDQPAGGPMTEKFNQVVFIFDNEDNLVTIGWDPNSERTYSRFYIGAASAY